MIDGVYWTLTCELFFYLTVFLALFFHKKYLGGYLIIISIVAAIQSFDTGPLFFFNQWPAFGLGLAVYCFFNGAITYRWVIFSALLVINLVGLYYKFGVSAYSICTLTTVVIIFGSHYIKQPANIFATLGKHSYSVYLIHVPVGVYILGLLETNAIKQNPWLNFLYDLAVFTGISIIAWIMYDNVERKSIRVGKRIYEKYRHPLTEPAIAKKTVR